MSLDMISLDRGLPGADASSHRPVDHSAPPVTPSVLPSRADGYAQTTDIRSKLSAFVITAALHMAALGGFLLYRTPEIIHPSPPVPLVVTLLPLSRPPAQTQRKVIPQKPLPKAPKSIQPVMTRAVPQPLKPAVNNPLPATPMVAPAAMSAPPPTAPPTAPEAVARPAPAPAAAGSAKDSWEGRVLARLEQAKRFPSAARSRREQGVTTIRFRLDRQGHVLSSSIAQSSGSAILDQEALATLARAQPLPPIPADRPDPIELIVPIEFSLLRR